MAFLQTDFPPSTAPASRTRRVVRPRQVQVAPHRSLGVVRIAVMLFAFLAVVAPGYLAFVATESLALGALASDFIFLLAIATWSSVSRR